MNKVLVTGTAGFIGFHLTKRLIYDGFEVVGLDIINDYYDKSLKHARLEHLGITVSSTESNKLIASSLYTNLKFIKTDLAEHHFIIEMMKEEKFDFVVNLAAQAGVRYSIDNPLAYTHSNVDGFLSILEGARHSKVKHLVYASTSSVYGLNTAMPLKETTPTEHPMALYAATKKANEMMAHSYSHLFDLPTSGLRFFTVYGPWGRPDMALFLFAEAMRKGEAINVFNHGNMIRDFTYVDDIVESITRLIVKPPMRNSDWNGDQPRIDTSTAPYRIFNIGNGSPVKLMRYIEAVETALGLKGKYNMMDIQPGDVPATHADTKALQDYIDFRPETSVEEGVNRFIEWYKMYYNI
ncbi:NAD-dependent epimerase/dehydratase family protein [Schleiferiaceae bacterium]|nr:NAD-dependent epimerase/dehydratase family protein [Schleiferiaceae bacterium]